MSKGRRYIVKVRRTRVQTQTVEFIADDLINSDTQRRVAAAYAQPELWADEQDETVIVSLDSEPIDWTQT